FVGPIDEEGARCLRSTLQRNVFHESVLGSVRIGLPDRLAPPSASIAMTKEDIRRAIQANITDVADCASEDLDLDRPNFYLRYQVRFEIVNDRSLRCIEAETHDPSVAAFSCCVLTLIKDWRFPSFEGEKSFVFVNYPFVIESDPSQDAEME